MHAVLHRALRDAVRWGLISRNPIEMADPPRISTAREMHTWDPDSSRLSLRSPREDRLHALWQLLALTGMRRGEACGLRWRDCDLKQGRVAAAPCPGAGSPHACWSQSPDGTGTTFDRPRR